eukprot:6174037-Pleurochrysis_carterae.AAC.1
MRQAPSAHAAQFLTHSARWEPSARAPSRPQRACRSLERGALSLAEAASAHDTNTEAPCSATSTMRRLNRGEGARNVEKLRQLFRSCTSCVTALRARGGIHGKCVMRVALRPGEAAVASR